MYVLKKLPEDFIVGERLRRDFRENGQYSYYLLWKRELSTIDAISKLSRRLKIQRKLFNYCGLKDKHAITTQFISISKGPRFPVNEKDLKLFYLGSGDERLSLGKLEGNRFIITIRNLDSKPKTVRKMLNLFDDQRFGAKGTNAMIGKLLVKKQFDKAAVLMADNHDEVMAALEKRPTDYVGAIKKLPQNVIRLYLHAYQSKMWNKAADQLSSSGLKELPIVGFDTEFDSERVEQLFGRLLKEDGITLRDFIIPQLQGLSLEGSSRSLFAEIKDLEIRHLQEDEMHPSKKKCVVSFTLQKGAYATQAIRQICR